jgi:nicotinate-nucleotide adenylyltransferase
MRFGIFGGTFDPPHLGHAMACLWALETGEVDRVLMIPTARHAFGKQPAAGFDHRLAMCRLAARHLGEHVEISDIEGRREGVSYMVDTLRALAADRPGATFRLLVGTDIVGDVPKWRESAEILRLAPLLVLPRLLPGDRPEARPGALPAVSSTVVRAALRGHGSTGELIARSVRDYITANRLYEQD